MTLSDWANIAVIAQTIFVIISIGIIWYQLRENTRLARVANSQKFVEIITPFHQLMIQDPGIAELWLKGAQAPATLSEIDLWRYRRLLHSILNTMENTHLHQREKLSHELTYTYHQTTLQHMISEGHFEEHWNVLKEFFEPSFAQYIDQLIKKKKKISSSLSTEQHNPEKNT